jgi:DNA-binding response OmpR family regulator
VSPLTGNPGRHEPARAHAPLLPPCAGFGSGMSKHATHPIAIVNNEPRILDLLSRSFIDIGYSVRSYLSATEALNALVTAPVDLAVLDWTNPPLGGRNLFIAIKLKQPATRIVFVSPHDDVITATFAASSMRPDDIIGTPFRIHDIIARVIHCLDCPSPSSRL